MALQKAKGLDLPAIGTLMLGLPTQQIINHAEETQSDLVCVTAHYHGAFECFILGSISRALVIGAKQSILIAKGQPEGAGDLKVVIATDHSSYSNRCMDELFKFAPAGLGEVTVLSVIEPDRFIPISPEAAKVMIEEEQKQLESVQSKTEELRRRFEGLGAKAHAKVVTDDPKTQIAATMHETGADLLIMGAQGHGFFERLAVGSVALQQVVTENYPVLIIRT
jgi:nucleotide-binding universal stress UspA family protein